jgi:hypothetical protein
MSFSLAGAEDIEGGTEIAVDKLKEKVGGADSA